MPDKTANITIRRMREGDLDEADRITRLAFGTFLGLPDPMTFMGDANFIHTRWKADPSAAIVAESAGEVVGSCLVTRWGSVAFFGPLTVRPDFWNQGVAQKLLESVMSTFDKWNVDLAGLFTFPHSTKHIHLYQKFGFWPLQLTGLIAKEVGQPHSNPNWTKYSNSSGDAIDACRELTNDVYSGLDVAGEIKSIADHNLGETVLLWDDGELAGLAVCHIGPGTEAGSDTCYIKFGAVRPGAGAGERFENLLAAVESMASDAGIAKITTGINTSHHDAYRRLLARGFRTNAFGVIMQRNNNTGYRRPENYILDDWR